jgi:16S rRNA pseudouridine516 synthase
MAKSKANLAAALQQQGFGTRKECARLVRAGLVEVGREEGGSLGWRKAESPAEEIPLEDTRFRVNGLELPWMEKAYVALHKPANTECSHAPSHHRSVFSLLPDPLVRRGLQAVGRLDADTTGLLLLTDSGPFNHFLTSPRRHVPKTYRVAAKHPVSVGQAERLAGGVDLRSEDEPTMPARIVLTGDRECEITIEEGRYHQVKRMFAAVGNRVEGIHRIAIGGLALPDHLAPGQWFLLGREELDLLGFREE